MARRSRRKSRQISRWNERRSLRMVKVKREKGDTTRGGMPWPPPPREDARRG